MITAPRRRQVSRCVARVTQCSASRHGSDQGNLDGESIALPIGWAGLTLRCNRSGKILENLIVRAAAAHKPGLVGKLAKRARSDIATGTAQSAKQIGDGGVK